MRQVVLRHRHVCVAPLPHRTFPLRRKGNNGTRATSSVDSRLLPIVCPSRLETTGRRSLNVTGQREHCTLMLLLRTSIAASPLKIPQLDRTIDRPTGSHPARAGICPQAGPVRSGSVIHQPQGRECAPAQLSLKSRTFVLPRTFYAPPNTHSSDSQVLCTKYPSGLWGALSAKKYAVRPGPPGRRLKTRNAGVLFSLISITAAANEDLIRELELYSTQ